MGLHSIKIKNFKSIRETNDILIKPLNILIGSNGVGKSNFIIFFKFLNRLYQKQLQLYISRNGRADDFLYFGRKFSDYLYGKIVFDDEWKNEYEFSMVSDQDNNLIFEFENSNYIRPNSNYANKNPISAGGNLESKIQDDSGSRNNYLRSQFEGFKLFHFHDTSFNSKIKQPSNSLDYALLHEDGGNIAAFLYRLQHSNLQHFKVIENVIRSIAPFFDKFYLQPDEINSQQIYLRWQEKGSEELFNAHNFSDGTLRMICLTTLLMQPELPNTIIIDEPELGLHPSAIQKLAAMLKIASINSQIIVSTQSINLVDQFSANDIIVVERENNQSVFKRQNEESLSVWREEYSLGELWSKNVLGGTP